MAKPIEATPVLYGKQAQQFLKDIRNPKPYTPQVFDLEKIHAEVRKIMKADAKK